MNNDPKTTGPQQNEQDKAKFAPGQQQNQKAPDGSQKTEQNPAEKAPDVAKAS